MKTAISSKKIKTLIFSLKLEMKEILSFVTHYVPILYCTDTINIVYN